MSQRPYLSKALRAKIAQNAKERCSYCLTAQSFTAMPMHIEHIIPLAANGASTEDNLCLACALCNAYKGSQTEFLDPETNTQVALFHPRQQVWAEHFRWSEDGITIIGQSACGRATVIALKLNNPHYLKARRKWVEAGWHPPGE